MIWSMTGFGRAESTENGSTVVVEVHSFNGRFLDIKMKLPRALYEYEAELRKIVQEYVRRGKVSLNVSLNRGSARADAVEIDFCLADKYVGLSKEMASRYCMDSNMDVRTLMALPDVFVWNENGCENGALWALTKKTARSALETHRAMRRDEGAALECDIESRLGTVSELLKQVKKRIPEVVEDNKVRLRKRIETLVGKDTVDEIRFAMEVALYADRIDVTEECVRIKSHIEQFSREISGETASGKKLLFLLQEMNREANTIGSKIMDADCTQTVVRIKEELEKIREQAENTE